MTDQVKAVLASLPDAPGVYKMLGKEGDIIYIGKSKCLKHRVKSYFTPNPNWEKAINMAPFIQNIEIEVTDTHLEAMLLECALIKRIRPYFNVIMKYDNRYIYLRIGENTGERPLKIVNEREGRCFGPLKKRYPAVDAIDALKRLYPIRKEGRRFCFEYHAFPEDMEEEDYRQNRDVLIELFSSPPAMERFFKELDTRMRKDAKEFRYESAARYRDVIRDAGYLKTRLSRHYEWMNKTLVAEIALADGSGTKLFYIYKGYVVHKKKTAAVTDQVLEEFRAEGDSILKEQRKEIRTALQEKGMADYRDIVFAELAGLEEGKVHTILNRYK